jgi:chaperonin GroES
MAIYKQEYMQELSTSADKDRGYLDKKANIELLKKYAKEIDISQHIDEQVLYKFGKDLVQQVVADDNTRSDWFDKYNEALKIAKQAIEVKEYPFENASNVQIPLILQACVQFNARVLPEIQQNKKTVYVAIAGTPSLNDEQTAERISDHMSLQTMEQVGNWISDTDKMLIVLPLVGTVFRKWSYDPISRKPCSTLCLPTEIIISNDVSSIEKAERVTHSLRLNRNEIIERMRFGIFNENSLDDTMPDDTEQNAEDVNYASNDEDRELPSQVIDSKDNYIFWEIATWLDLDEDGYCEPYTVTIRRKGERICRIAARYDEKDFVLNTNGELIRINPKIYITAHHFLPSPDGTFLGMGFGQMLLQLNSAINSITNQLIDAGTMANMQGGFISKDLRMRKGELEFTPGEWKLVNFNIGLGNLSNHIYPLPFKEPSQTLMSLLQFLVDFGKQTANISDILMGNPQTANMPATSVVSLIQQGSVVYSSILQRLYNSFSKEFNILFNINKQYLSLYPDKDLMTKNGFVTVNDYNSDLFNVYPVANPSLGMENIRLTKLQMLLSMQNPLINQQEVLKRLFIALGMPEPEKLFTPQNQQPSLQDQLVMSQIQAAQAQAQLSQAQIQETAAITQEVNMRAAKIGSDIELDAINIELNERKIQVDAANKGGNLAIGKANAIATLATAESKATQQEMKSSERIVDKETSTNKINVDFSDINAKINQNSLKNTQNNGNVLQGNQNNGGNPLQESPSNMDNAQQAQGNPVSNKGISPELSKMLQQVAENQNSSQDNS